MVRMSFLNCSCNGSIARKHSMKSFKPLLTLFQKKSKDPKINISQEEL